MPRGIIAGMSAVVKRTVRLAVARLGSQTELGRRLGISRQAIDQWDTIPARHCLTLEEITGVSRHEMRPDIYGCRPAQQSTAA